MIQHKEITPDQARKALDVLSGFAKGSSDFQRNIDSATDTLAVFINRMAPSLTVINYDEWAPCSPEWLENHPNDCGVAPRVYSERDKNHYHPKSWPTSQPPGWKLVPVDPGACENDDSGWLLIFVSGLHGGIKGAPTGWSDFSDEQRERIKAAYRSMIAAAPTTPIEGVRKPVYPVIAETGYNLRADEVQPPK